MSHRPHAELLREIEEVKKQVIVGRDYIHRKYPDKRYRVVDIGIQEESEKVCVIYCDITTPLVHFVRDFDSWQDRFTRAGTIE